MQKTYAFAAIALLAFSACRMNSDIATQILPGASPSPSATPPNSISTSTTTTTTVSTTTSVTIRSSSTTTTTLPPAPALPNGPTPIMSPGAPFTSKMYDDYSPNAPHFKHISVTAHGGYLINLVNPATEYDFAVQHYDLIFSTPAIDQIKSRNATVKALPYALMVTMIQPGQNYPDALDDCYFTDMQNWFTKHSGCLFENAFVHEPDGSRRVRVIWGSNRWLINAADSCVRQYDADRLLRFMRSLGTAEADGVFIDEARPMDKDYIGTQEYPLSTDTTRVENDEVGMMAAVSGALAASSKILQINVGDFTDPYTINLVGAAQAGHLEYYNNIISNMSFKWGRLDAMLSTGALIQLPTPYNDPTRLTRIATLTAGNEVDVLSRTRLFELVSYYMALSTPDKIWLNVTNSMAAPRGNYFKAYETNVGMPVRARSVLSKGTDPDGQSYEVDQRLFIRALMLSRPMVSGKATIYDDTSAVTVPLPTSEVWYVLRMDGTLSATPVTQIQLRNNEAAILVRGSYVGVP